MTLDEVIIGIKEQMGLGDPILIDALFYLKEYRWVQENCADVLAEKYPSENIPLTWDELKQMKGKPVWVEDNIDGPKKSIKCWAICRGTEKNSNNRIRFTL